MCQTSDQYPQKIKFMNWHNQHELNFSFIIKKRSKTNQQPSKADFFGINVCMMHLTDEKHTNRISSSLKDKLNTKKANLWIQRPF